MHNTEKWILMYFDGKNFSKTLFKYLNLPHIIYKHIRNSCELNCNFVKFFESEKSFFAAIAESPIDCVTLRQILNSHDTGNSYRRL